MLVARCFNIRTFEIEMKYDTTQGVFFKPDKLAVTRTYAWSSTIPPTLPREISVVMAR